jgi:DNA-binding winged helix-turn-helix (wHTH) protein/predicted ATPase
MAPMPQRVSRGPAGPAAGYRFGAFRVLADLDLLYRGDEVIPLEPRAVRVLRYLVQHADRVVGKEELLDRVWSDTFITDGVLKKAVSQIRRALDDPPQESRFIETYHRRGYRFLVPVEAARVARAPELPQTALLRAAAADLDFDQFAGREAELETLCAEYRRALARKATPLLVIGEAGLGKTQLSRHFQDWATGQGARCLYTRFFDYDGSRLAPYEVLLGLLRVALGDSETPDPAPRTASLRELAAARFGIELPAELFGGSEGLSQGAPLSVSSREAAALSRQAVAAISRCFVALSREAPVVVQLDDLQWADPISLEVVGDLLQAARGERLLVAAFSRPPGAGRSREPFSEWLRQQASLRGFCEVPLRGLGPEGFRRALAAILGCSGGEPDIAAADLAGLHRLTGGNPYFLTEVLRVLAAEGVIRRPAPDRPCWRCERLRDLRLPATLATAARSHLDELDPDVRGLLEHAAVIGDEVRVVTLSRMAGLPPSEVEQLLSRALLAGAMAVDQLSPGEDCRFRHTIVRRALYDGLPPWRRRSLHVRAAEVMEQIYAAEQDRVAEALAAHYRVAGDAPRCFVWSLRAAQAALVRWQWSDALASAQRAEEAAAELERGGGSLSRGDQIALRLALGQSLAALGQPREAETALESAAAAAGEMGDEKTLATVFFHLAQARVAQGRQAEARTASERALALLAEQGDEEARALAVSQLAGVRIAMGEYAAAAETLTGELARARHRPEQAARLSGLLGWAHALQGSFAEAVRLLEAAVAERRAADDPRGLATVLWRLQWAHLGRGEHSRALALIEEARAAFHSAGDRLGLARLDMALGQVLIARGLPARGVEALRRAAPALRDLGDVHCEAEALWLTGQGLAELGLLAEAEALLGTALARVREVPDRDDEFRAAIDLARVRVEQGGADSARLGLDLARHAAAIAADLGCRDGAGKALVEVAAAHHALGSWREGLAAAEEAAELLSTAGSGELWRALWVLGLAQERWSAPLSLVTLDRCRAALAGQRAELDPEDRRGFEEVRRGPLRDLHRLLLQSGDAEGSRALRREWPGVFPVTGPVTEP